jgi:uncharacterized protein YjeT (DUF2065 family)
MSFRGFLVILLVLAGLLYYFGKPQQWWGEMTRAASKVHTLPDADSAP